ncbi:hypothetical protein IAT40_001093 [Kwoniella sp. CBS 6097]
MPADSSNPTPAGVSPSYLTTYDIEGDPYPLLNRPGLFCDGTFVMYPNGYRSTVNRNGQTLTQRCLQPMYLQKRSAELDFDGMLCYPHFTNPADEFSEGGVTGKAHSVNTVALPDLSKRYQELVPEDTPDLFSRFLKISLGLSNNDHGYSNSGIEPAPMETLDLANACPQAPIESGSIPVSSCIFQSNSDAPGGSVPPDLSERHIAETRKHFGGRYFWNNYPPSVHSMSHNMKMNFLPEKSLLRDDSDSAAMELLHALYGGRHGLTVKAETSTLIAGHQTSGITAKTGGLQLRQGSWWSGWTERVERDPWIHNGYTALPIEAPTSLGDPAEVLQPTEEGLIDDEMAVPSTPRIRGAAFTATVPSESAVPMATIPTRRPDSHQSHAIQDTLARRVVGRAKYVGWQRPHIK